MSGKYDDILHLPHPTSSRHPTNASDGRSVRLQFSPFAALTGHGAAVSETARLTDRKAELSEDIQGLLDLKQHLLLEHIDEQPEISVTWFRPDARKEGGQYRTVTARLQRVDAYARLLVLTDGTRIPLDDVADLQCPLFSGLQ